MWILRNSINVLSSLAYLGVCKATTVQAVNFSSLFTSVTYGLPKPSITIIIINTHRHKSGTAQHDIPTSKSEKKEEYFSSDSLDSDNKYTANDICQFLVDCFSDRQ